MLVRTNICLQPFDKFSSGKKYSHHKRPQLSGEIDPNIDLSGEFLKIMPIQRRAPTGSSRFAARRISMSGIGAITDWDHRGSLNAFISI
jgi:hypothetical protein